MTLAKGHLCVFCRYFQRASHLKLHVLGQFQISYAALCKGGKESLFCPGHMTMMAAMLIYGKVLRNPLLQNHWTGCLETWYVVFWTLVLQSLY